MKKKKRVDLAVCQTCGAYALPKDAKDGFCELCRDKQGKKTSSRVYMRVVLAVGLLLCGCTKRYYESGADTSGGNVTRRHYQGPVPTNNAVIPVGGLNAADDVVVYLAHDGIYAPGDPNAWVPMSRPNGVGGAEDHWCYIDYAAGTVHLMNTPALGHLYKIIVTHAESQAPAYKSLLEGRY